LPVGAKLRAPAAGRGDTVIVRLVGTELLRVTVPLVPAKAAVEAMKEVTATSPEATKTRPSEVNNIIFNTLFCLWWSVKTSLSASLTYLDFIIVYIRESPICLDKMAKTNK
jgi:hypothetical protein